MLMFAVGTALMATSCKSTKDNKITTFYTVTTPEVTSTSVSKDYVASIQSQKNIEIRAQQGGILQDIYVDEGQMVKWRSLMFRIGNSWCARGGGKVEGGDRASPHRLA